MPSPCSETQRKRALFRLSVGREGRTGTRSGGLGSLRNGQLGLPHSARLWRVSCGAMRSTLGASWGSVGWNEEWLCCREAGQPGRYLSGCLQPAGDSGCRRQPSKVRQRLGVTSATATIEDWESTQK